MNTLSQVNLRLHCRTNTDQSKGITQQMRWYNVLNMIYDIV